MRNYECMYHVTLIINMTVTKCHIEKNIDVIMLTTDESSLSYNEKIYKIKKKSKSRAVYMRKYRAQKKLEAQLKMFPVGELHVIK